MEVTERRLVERSWSWNDDLNKFTSGLGWSYVFRDFQFLDGEYPEWKIVEVLKYNENNLPILAIAERKVETEDFYE